MWWQVAELFHFAETAGAQIRLRDADALSLTWDCGRSWQHVWNTSGEHAQAFYGESEYAETRVPTMISDYSELMLNWAVLRIGRKARFYKGWEAIRVPRSPQSVDPHWGFEQLSLITGRLTRDGKPVPMQLRTIFPDHYELNQFSHLAGMRFKDLLAAFKDPAGGILANWVEPAPSSERPQDTEKSESSK